MPRACLSVGRRPGERRTDRGGQAVGTVGAGENPAEVSHHLRQAAAVRDHYAAACGETLKGDDAERLRPERRHDKQAMSAQHGEHFTGRQGAGEIDVGGKPGGLDSGAEEGFFGPRTDDGRSVRGTVAVQERERFHQKGPPFVRYQAANKNDIAHGCGIGRGGGEKGGIVGVGDDRGSHRQRDGNGLADRYRATKA